MFEGQEFFWVSHTRAAQRLAWCTGLLGNFGGGSMSNADMRDRDERLALVDLGDTSPSATRASDHRGHDHRRTSSAPCSADNAWVLPTVGAASRGLQLASVAARRWLPPLGAHQGSAGCARGLGAQGRVVSTAPAGHAGHRDRRQGSGMRRRLVRRLVTVRGPLQRASRTVWRS